MLEIKELDVEINKIPIIRKLSLSIPNGIFAGLVGRNGAGKTTLLRSIMGVLKIKSGEILFNNENIVNYPPYNRIKYGIGYMPEDRRLVPDLTVQENILLPLWSLKSNNYDEKLDLIYSMIPEIKKFAKKKASQLSGGQQKLVALARALVVGKSILLLDEPFEGVAPALAKRLLELLQKLKSLGTTILITESEYKHAVGLLDMIFYIERGTIVKQENIN
ncbi:ATP-binding cassette domain-containing protein [Deferribacter autotrophicus]|uniref:ATP-binding cassette domain-containing protein n=1 Tax=Deferribacter autotrophicus TaxID=500465 RepID=A0A5A8EZR0_9BACT|nr:ATP-binding cassette domain-containing protein [Deferribacter autotrophicus]KAA0256854.1 ATP-binding cassette domain-containing protein [Deferribacter autotrophicus]